MTPTALKIKALRESTELSREDFTFQILRDLGVKCRTLVSWEQGTNAPHETKLEAVEKRVSEYLKEKKRCKLKI